MRKIQILSTLLLAAGIVWWLGQRAQAPILKAREEKPPETEAPAPASLAQLIRAQNTVNFRRAQNLVWEEAKALLPLFRRDALQTRSKSQALIRYDSGSEVFMNENTFLIIDMPKSVGENNLTIDRAVMREGRIHGETSREMWILTGAALVKLKSKKSNEIAKLDVNMTKENTVSLKLESGEGQILLPTGANEARQVDLKPSQEMTIPFKKIPDDFGLKAEATDWMETVTILTDAIASPVNEQKTAEVPEEAPHFQVDEPANKSHINKPEVSFVGLASPLGSLLKINGKKCEIKEGRFSCLVSLDPGPNLFVLQLTTPKGKTIFKRWLISRVTTE